MKITVDREKREATVDFTGTSPEQKNNFNAPEPVTRAAVLYAFRVMVEDNIPMNAGCLRPINIVIPEGSMLAPRYPARRRRRQCRDQPARHQRLFGALGALASAQGTMNNLTFGNAQLPVLRDDLLRLAGRRLMTARGFDGTDGVHTHMTNSRLTDPEVLELRFPVLLEDFHIREGSGGKGKWSAGGGTSAPSASSRRWTAPSSPRTATCRRTALTAAATAQLGTTEVRRTRRPHRDARRLRPDRARAGRGGDRHDADGRRIREGGCALTPGQVAASPPTTTLPIDAPLSTSACASCSLAALMGRASGERGADAAFVDEIGHLVPGFGAARIILLVSKVERVNMSSKEATLFLKACRARRRETGGRPRSARYGPAGR